MKNLSKIITVSVSALIIVPSIYLFLISTNKSSASDNINTNDQSLNLVNNIRSEKGLKALTLDSKLSEAANKKAQDMIANNYFSHISSKNLTAWNFILDSGYDYSIAGENLAMDYEDVDSAFKGWIESPSHLSNIISSKYTDYGYGMAIGKINGKETKVQVQLFGSKQLQFERIFSK